MVLILQFDSSVILYIGDYEIFTTTKIIFLILLFMFFIGFSFNYIINIFAFFKKNRTISNVNNKYDKYLNNIYNSILYGFSGDIEKANHFIKDAQKNLYNKLTDLISVIFNNNKKIGNGLFNYHVELSRAMQEKDDAKAIENANKILEIQKNNKYCKEVLYNINKENGNWFKCLELFNKNYVNKSIDERKLLYKNLSIEFYNKNDLQNAFKYAELLFKIDKNDLDNNKIIVNSLKNSNKLCKYIEKIWKYTPYQEAGDLYCNNDIKKAKKLYKMNKKDVESVVYYSNILLNNNMDVDNKIIEYLRQYNDDCVYQLFLRIKNSNH